MVAKTYPTSTLSLVIHPQSLGLSWAHVGAGGAVPQVGYLAQVLWQVVLVLCLGGQLQVPAERIQPHGVGSEDGGGGCREGLSGQMSWQAHP